MVVYIKAKVDLKIRKAIKKEAKAKDVSMAELAGGILAKKFASK